MNSINESILMFIVVMYFLFLRALYSALRSSRVSKGLVLNLFMAFNFSSVVVLAYKGLPLAMNGFRPSLSVLLMTIIICSFVLLRRVNITSMPFFDSLLVSFMMVGTAAVLPIGLHKLFQDGFRMVLVWPWIVSTLTMTLCSIMTSRAKRKKKGKQDRLIKSLDTGKAHMYKEVL